MKTSIDIDDALIANALKATGINTGRGVVEIALKLLIQIKQQEAIKTFRGRLPWDGDLAAMRTNL